MLALTSRLAAVRVRPVMSRLASTLPRAITAVAEPAMPTLLPPPAPMAAASTWVSLRAVMLRSPVRPMALLAMLAW